jgi:hypothetical protein
MTQFTEVYRDGTLVDRRMSSGAYDWDAPADEHTYKVVTDTTLDADRWKLSTKGHSEWTFRSSATPDDRWTFLPLLNLAYDIDTDLAGKVRGGARIPVGISASYVVGAPDTGTIGGGRLEVSYDDGKSWRAVRLTGGKGDWQGSLTVPRDAGFVSLRALAEDDQGGSVSQEIIRAVGVK